MRTLYLDCGMGAAGDMLAAALLELMPNPDEMISELNALGIPGVQYIREKTSKCGITGTHLSVLVNGVDEADLYASHAHEHHHEHEHEHEHEHSHEHDHEHSHEHEHEHHEHGHSYSHSGMREIQQIVMGLHLPRNVEENVLAVYHLIAGAESTVHGVPVT